MGFLNTILTLILFMLLATLAFFAWQFYPSEEVPLKINLNQELPEASGVSDQFSQFVPNMRFDSNNLNFYIYEGCEQEKLDRIRASFNIISTETTIMKFNEQTTYNSETDIKIFCRKLEKEISENQFVAGEGGPSEYYDLSLYPLIKEGEILLYDDSRSSGNCAYPVVELHELLHVFGFDHINKKDSIMYPYSSCDQKIDEEIVNELVRLYSQEAKSDILFTQAEASKAGRYLDFDVKIQNRGLVIAKNSLLIVTGKEKIDEFDLGDLEPGTTKTLSIKNLVLDSRTTNEVTFTISTDTEEYFTNNNEFKAILQ